MPADCRWDFNSAFKGLSCVCLFLHRLLPKSQTLHGVRRVSSTSNFTEIGQETSLNADTHLRPSIIYDWRYADLQDTQVCLTKFVKKKIQYEVSQKFDKLFNRLH